MAISEIAKQRPNTKTQGPICSVCQALQDLPETEAAALRKLLSDRDWRFTRLSEALAEDPDTPLNLSPSVLAWHANGRCAAGEKLR